jgi:hypothetical protein
MLMDAAFLHILLFVVNVFVASIIAATLKLNVIYRTKLSISPYAQVGNSRNNNGRFDYTCLQPANYQYFIQLE